MKKIFSFLVLLLFAFSVKSQTDYTIGTATGSNTNTSYPAPLQDYFEGSRSQYLYLASELQAAGMTAGLINSIKFDVSSLNNFSGTVEQYTISIGSTTVSALSSTSWEAGTSPVYGPVDYTPVTGTNEFIFSAPFFWDGTSNIIVEICNGDPNSGAAGNTTWTGNPSSPWTTGLGFNAAHTYRADNVGYSCGTTQTAQTGTLDTRPDVTFSWVAAVACSGTPVAGNATTNKSNVCVNEPFYLSVVNGFLGTGLTYQWQDSSATTGGVWHNITGATNYSYSIPAGINANTCYRRKTVCTNSNVTVYTSKVCITVKPFYECYCNPLIGTTLYSASTTLEINSVAIVGGAGAVNYSNAHTPTNPAPSLGYASFIADTNTLKLKQGVAYTASVGTSITPTGAAMWVDWNHNNVFDSSEYSIVRYDAGVTSADVVIDVPANATLGLTMVRFRTASSAINYNNSCASFGNGETEDYLVKIVPGTPCSGAPAGGDTKSTVDSICPNNPFTLSVINSTTDVINLTYQWEYSTTSATGPWTPITGATSKTYIAPTITTQMWFRRKITCGGSSSYSVPITVNTKPVNNCYCGPNTGIQLQGGSTPWIHDVEFTDGTYDWIFTSCGVNVDNTTPGLNFAYWLYDDTSCMAHLVQANTYTMNVTQTAAPTQASVWIDFDHSGSFEASERQNLTISGTTSTASISVPATAVPGITLMRVRIRAANITDACSENFSGETEDYVISILPGVNCSGTPTPGDALSSVDSICKNTPFNLSVQNATTGVIGLNYRWYKSTNGGTTWDSIPGATSTGYTVPSISVNTCFRRGIRCTSGTEVYSTPVCIIVKGQFDCYCGPNTGITLHSATSPSIDSVSLIYNGSPIYFNTSPGAPANGYNLFDDTASAARITQGENYTLLINNSAAPSQAAVWIDWDQSGTFESTEILNITPTKNGTTTIGVPTTALTGFTMMRIRIRAASFTDACETFGSGETEDYVVKVLPGVQCSGTPVGGTTISTASTLCKGITFTVSVTGSSTAVGVLGFSYQWQDSTIGGTWQNVSGLSTTLTYSTTLSNASRYFRRKIICANGNTFAYSTPVLVALNTPTYATLPFTESFETNWLDGCAAGSSSIPNNSWRNTPFTGDSSWRRNDDGTSAGWTNSTSGSYVPTGSSGTKSARLHTFSMAANATSSLDLHLNCSGGATYKRLSFDAYNVDGSDSLSILVSTDGGNTFTRIDSVGNRLSWSSKKIDFASTSATTIVRFKGYSDGGASTDIGIDNVSVISLLPIDIAATVIVAPTGSIGATSAGKVIITIKNVGGSVLDFSATPVTVGGKGLDPNSNPFNYQKTYNTGILAINASMNDTVTSSATFTTLGLWSIKGYAIITGDGNAANDSTVLGTFQVNSPAKVAVASGFWGDGATWSGGTVPVATDTVNISGFTVTLSGGAQPSPYFCSSLGIGANGVLIANADVLNIGPANGGNKAFNIASGGTLNITGATINHNGYVLFNSGANLNMSGGNLNVDGNDGTNVGSVPTGTDEFAFGTTSAGYSSGNISLSGGTITIVDPHRTGGAAFAYRGTIFNNITTGNHTLVFGTPTSTHTAASGAAGFLLNLSTGGGRLTLMNLTINGGNTVGNRFATAQANIGINGNLTINPNSEFRNAFQTYLAGNFTNNGIFASSNIFNFQTFLNATAGVVTTAQTLSGNGTYRNTIPNAGLSSGGSGYTVGDVLTLTGGNSVTPLSIYVSAVNGSGAITSAVILNMGNYITAPPTSASAVTGGTGTGATFTSANVISNSNFGGLVFNNTSASGITINSFGTALAAQTGTIVGTGVLNMRAGIINNLVPITLGVSTVQRGTLNYTSGLITGKFTRWFTNATNDTTTGDFPVGKGTICKNARVEFKTAPTKGGTLTAEFVATAPGTGGMPLTDGAVTLTNIANDGFWRIDTDSITGGNYTISITDSGIVNAQTLSTLRIVKRPSNTTNWTLDGVAGTNTGTLTKPTVVRTGAAGFSEFAIAGGSDNLLPSTAMTLTGEKVGRTNHFNWAVLNEISVKGYELQRSTDSRSFEPITFVNAKGNGTNNGTVIYNYASNSSIYNDGYYRLKQISKDGSTAYSNVVLIKGLKVNNVTLGNVFPNPTKDIINMVVASPKSGSVVVTITDMSGKFISRQNKSVAVGDNTLSMNVNSLAAGTYLLSITDLSGDKSNVVSFVKAN